MIIYFYDDFWSKSWGIVKIPTPQIEDGFLYIIFIYKIFVIYANTSQSSLITVSWLISKTDLDVLTDLCF